MAVSKLDPKFLKHFNISGTFQPPKRGGQKAVHFVVRDGRAEVMKLFNEGRDERFTREMEIYEKFKHLNGLPKIYATCDYEDEVVVFEEYIDGNTLSDICTGFKDKNREIKTLLLEILETLKPIWESGYVHRDLKPENIMIRKDGKPVILDFGIARDLGAETITAAGMQPGSFRWWAPEQYFGRKDLISHRTDIFSLGVIGYFLYYQVLPFGNDVNQINENYKNDSENFDTTADCELNNFLLEALRFKSSQRPRLISDIIKLLQ